MDESTISPLPIRSYHAKDTEAAFVAWNEKLAMLQKCRVELGKDSELLRASVVAPDGDPAGVPLAVVKLYGRRLALDVEEARLLEAKHEFKKSHLAARSAEVKRLAACEQKRTEEVLAVFKKAGVESPLLQGVMNGDARLRELKAARASVATFENVVTAGDDERGAVLMQRIRAAVPAEF